jgi:hypothetical protein
VETKPPQFGIIFPTFSIIFKIVSALEMREGTAVTYRTCKMNSVFSSISEQSRLYQQEEFSSPLFLDSNSGLVVPLEQFSNHFMDDLRRLAAMIA